MKILLIAVAVVVVAALAVVFGLAAFGEDESTPTESGAPAAIATTSAATTPSPTPTPEPTPTPFTPEGYLSSLRDDPPSSVRMKTSITDFAGLPENVSIEVETTSLPHIPGRQSVTLEALVDGEIRARVALIMDGEFIYTSPEGIDRWLRTKQGQEEGTIAEMLPLADDVTGFFAALPDPASVSYEGETDCAGIPCHVLVSPTTTLEVRVEDEIPIQIISELTDGSPLIVEIVGWDEGLDIEIPEDARDAPASSFWQVVITVLSAAFI